MSWINFTDFTGNSATFASDYLVGFIGVKEQKYPVVALKNGLSAGLFTAQNLLVTEDTTIRGNLSVFGTQSVFETIVSVTSALSVVNTGTGPALTIQQTGVQPIALFLDDNNNTFRIDDDFKVSFFNSHATGSRSIAEGNNTKASGINSHAEGVITTASGNNSHAEGSGSVATSFACHAEGSATAASGVNSHAEGSRAVASGNTSHAQGEYTTASGDYSHAEGKATATGRRNAWFAYNPYTAIFTFAPAISANFAYVVPGTILQGYENIQVKDFITITVASRNSTTGAISAILDVIGDSPNSGYLIDNSGHYGHAEGASTTASGQASHAQGISTTASASGASTQGLNTLASGNYSHAAGAYAVAAHDRTWIWKGSTITNRVSTTRTDQFVVSAAGGVYIPGNMGIGTDNNTNALTVVGTISGNNLTTSFGQGSATGAYSFAEGSGRAFGDYSHAEGQVTTASGDSSHAEGESTVASGAYSHAEGYITAASGPYSHAEGDSTVASGQRSHAEGNYTVASGDFSHAEGNNSATGRRNAFDTYTVATKTFTFAPAISANFAYVTPGTVLRGYEDDNIENFFNITVASRSAITGAISAVADTIGSNSSNGYLIDASGLLSHAEGDSTVASGQRSHAEGNYTVALGVASHAQGSNTVASGQSSHAEGQEAVASGLYSHAEGYATATGRRNAFATYTQATKTFTFAPAISANFAYVTPGTVLRGREEFTLGGFFTITVASRSAITGAIVAIADVIEGDSTDGYLIDNAGTASHAEGQVTTASGDSSHAEGANTVASGTASHAEGDSTVASGAYSHAEGYNTVASSYSHAEGVATTASGSYSHVEGLITATGRRNAFVTYTAATKTFTFAPAISANFASAAPGTTLRGFDNEQLGDYFDIVVASRSAITGAIVATADVIGGDSGIGYLIDDAGAFSHAEGRETEASGNTSHAEGVGTVASGIYSHAQGLGTVASGTHSHAQGHATTASGNTSHAEGFGTATGRRNAFVTYTAATKTFTFAPTVSANLSYVTPGITLRGYEDDILGDYFNIVVASRSAITGAIVATADVIGGDSGIGYLIDAAGTYSHAQGINTTASGSSSHAEGSSSIASGPVSHAEGGSTSSRGFYSHSEGFGTVADGGVGPLQGCAHSEGLYTSATGVASHAQGINTTASGAYSHAAGSYAQAAHDRTWVWKGSTNVSTLCTTRTDQFVVSAANGLFLNNAVGINTDSIANALTVVGNISASGSLAVNPLTARDISIVHAPANDGTNPFFQLGEFTTGSAAFSGYRFEYNEITNALCLSSIMGSTVTNVLNVDPYTSVTPYNATFTPFTSGGIGNFVTNAAPGTYTTVYPSALSGVIPGSELSSRFVNNRGAIDGVLFFANGGAVNFKQYTLEFAKDAAFTLQKTSIYLRAAGETTNSIMRPVNGSFANGRIVMPNANATQPWGTGGAMIEYPYATGDSIYYRIGFAYPTAFETMGLSAGYIRIIP